MHKITNVTDRQGVVKQEFIDDMKAKHGAELLGDFIYYDYMKSNIEQRPSCCFEWADNSGKMMRTSYVESIEEHDDKKTFKRSNSYVGQFHRNQDVGQFHRNQDV